MRVAALVTLVAACVCQNLGSAIEKPTILPGGQDCDACEARPSARGRKPVSVCMYSVEGTPGFKECLWTKVEQEFATGVRCTGGVQICGEHPQPTESPTAKAPQPTDSPTPKSKLERGNRHNNQQVGSDVPESAELPDAKTSCADYSPAQLAHVAAMFRTCDDAATSCRDEVHGAAVRRQCPVTCNQCAKHQGLRVRSQAAVGPRSTSSAAGAAHYDSEPPLRVRSQAAVGPKSTSTKSDVGASHSDSEPPPAALGFGLIAVGSLVFMAIKRICVQCADAKEKSDLGVERKYRSVANTEDV